VTQPGAINNIVPRGDDWIPRRFKEIQDQIDALTTARTLESATIGKGGLIIDGTGGITVVDPNNGLYVMYIGSQPNGNASPPNQMVARFFRSDGTAALQLADDGTIPGHPQLQALQWYDRSGKVIVADDTNGGWGLARPHLPAYGMAQVDPTKWATNTTGSFTDLISGWLEIQNPYLDWGFWLYTDAASAQFRVMVNGTQVGTTQTVNNAWALYQANKIPFPGAGPSLFGTTVTVSVQGRIASGTGNARAECLFLQGDQS